MFDIDDIVSAKELAESGLSENSLFPPRKRRPTKTEVSELRTKQDFITALRIILATPTQLRFVPIKYHSGTGKPTHFRVQAYSWHSPSFEFVYGRDYRINGHLLSRTLCAELDSLMHRRSPNSDKIKPIIYTAPTSDREDAPLVALFIERASICIGGDRFGSDYLPGIRVTVVETVLDL